MPINKKTWLLGYPPYKIARPSAEITLTVNGQNKENGQTFTPSNPLIGTTVQYVVSVRNAGNAVLRLTNASRSGAVTAITAWSDLILGHGEIATSTVTFDTATSGAKSGTFTFNTNDPDGNEKVYTVNVSYTVLEMNIKVTLGVTQVTDGGSYAAGEYDESSVAQVTCTVENIGDALLTIQNPTVDGDIVSASAFSDLTLNPAQSVISTITLNTATSILTVARTGNIHIASDDPDTPSFDVQINFNANPVWLLDDQFTTAESAPLASPRTAEPTGTLTLVQTDGQFSISSNKLNFPAQSTPVWGDQGLYRASTFTRAAGLVLFGKLNFSINGGSSGFLGFGNGSGVSFSNIAGEAIFPLPGSGWALLLPTSGNRIVAGIPAAATNYDLAVIARSTGYYFLIKGGAFTNWSLLWASKTNSANLAPTFGNAGNTGTLDRFSVRQMANDWLNVNPIATSVLAGARSASDTFTHETNANIEWIQTTLPTALNTLMDCWQQDVDNKWEISISNVGTISLTEIVATVPTVRGTAVAVVANGHQIVVKRETTTIRIYSGAAGSEVLRIPYASATNFQTATAGELNSLGTGGAVSNIIVNPIAVPANALAELVKGLS